MSSRSLLGALVISFISSFSSAKNVSVFFGGGGEPASSDSTIFDQSYKTFAPFKKGSGWESRSYFDGGHVATEKMTAQLSEGKNKPMTTQNMNAEIASLKAQIESGELKKGDQLMLTLATHGLKQNAGQAAHSIATTDGTFDVSQMKELRDLAEKKGVKLAIVDYSCYSSATLNLAGDNTCVISSASDNVAYNNSGEALGKSMAKGTTLEMAFLAGRSAKNPGAPQISTEAGQKTFAETKMLTESMLHEVSLDDSLKNGSCVNTSSDQYKKLMTDLREIEKTQQSGPLVEPLENAIKEYSKAREYAELMFANRAKYDVDACEDGFCGNSSLWQKTHDDLIEKNFDTKLNDYEKRQLAAAKNILRTPNLMNWSAASAIYKNEAGNIKAQAEKVAAAERNVYQKLYEYHSGRSKKPNPCRDFKL